MNLVQRLNGEAIDGGEACCLGSQLAAIVDALTSRLGAANWYAADVEATGQSLLPKGAEAKLIGSAPQFIASFKNVDQFLCGVFIAVAAQLFEPRLRASFDTEDPLDVDLGDALVEIRAFDSSYFEVITQDSRLAEVVAVTFGVTALAE